MLIMQSYMITSLISSMRGREPSNVLIVRSSEKGDTMTALERPGATVAENSLTILR